VARASQAAEKVAQALLPVRFSQFSRTYGAIHRKNRTGKSACATKTYSESTFSAACSACGFSTLLGPKSAG